MRPATRDHPIGTPVRCASLKIEKTTASQVRAADLPFLHSYTTGLERDRAAVDAALTLPWHNGRTEGVNNKIKLIKRQTYGRAGHPLLRQRILLS